MGASRLSTGWRRQVGQVEDRANFDGAFFCCGDLTGNSNRVVEIVEVDQVVAANWVYASSALYTSNMYFMMAPVV
jgi:hypothetical protein